VVKTVRINYPFAHIRFNETVFVVYGSGPGLRIYNWNEEVIWDYTCDAGEVSECFLEHGLLFFTTSVGKAFVYDFFSESL
jgi:hypothetical protein